MQRIVNSNLEEHSLPVVMMADQRTMAQLLQAPTEGYEDAIVIPVISADNFELKHGLLTFVQNKQFFGHDKEDPHAHIHYFNKITSTLKFLNVPNTSIKLMLFPFSLEGAAQIWREKESPRSILTWDDLVLKFINQFFPPSKTTSLRNEITNFQQRFDESFNEAWDRFKDLLRACPHHGFLELHQLDTFYNALDSKDQDSLNFVAGGNFLDKMPCHCLSIIESKSKVHFSRDKLVVAKVSTNASTSGISPDVVELKDMVKALLLDKKGQKQSPALVKAVKESCVTCGGSCLSSSGSSNTSASTLSSGTLPSNTITNPKSDLKAITTQSGVSYDGLQIPPQVVENEPEVTKDTVNPNNNRNTKDFQPQAVQSESPVSISELTIAPVSASTPNQKASIPYPSKRHDERNHEKANNQNKKFYQIFKDISFEISFADAMILMPKFASTLKALIENKEKLSMAEYLALADLGASINLMPFYVWKRLSHLDLKPMYMTLELADHSISRPVGVAEDVYVKVGSFHFLADFIVVDFDADLRVPLILERSFLKTERALIDVFEGELTLQVGKEAITFNLDQTLRYSTNYSDMMAKRIDVMDMACDEYSQEVLGFFDTISSGNHTPYYDLIVFATSPTLTPGGILLLEAFLNVDPSLPPLNQRNYMPEVHKELEIYEAKTDKSSVDEPPVVELKTLPPHLEYAFLEGDDKLPVIIAKDLSMEEKSALLTVLKSHNSHQSEGSTENHIHLPVRNVSLSSHTFWAMQCSRQVSEEKSHFMVKEGIVLGHKISKKGIKVDKAKVDVISKLAHPTIFKGIRSFLGRAGFYRHFMKDFSKIARHMTRPLKKDTPFIFSQECVDAFQTFKRKLIEAPILIALDWDMPFKLICDANDGQS
uniref:Retrotransposon gag domain-containing protein n=1 Tax=Tanacetum cinerariifolium TaxID=118510 RepID=A0A699HH66_TANCI|nr:hypothetical protein [Tanacetum cinerariifolium]